MLNFQQELLTKKLKKSSEPTRDFSSPKLAGFTSETEVIQYQEGVLDLNFERWYEILSECTFPTVYCPIDIVEAKLFVSIYEKAFKDKDPTEPLNLDSILSDEQLRSLKSLEEKLNNKFSQFNSDGQYSLYI